MPENSGSRFEPKVIGMFVRKVKKFEQPQTNTF